MRFGFLLLVLLPLLSFGLDARPLVQAEPIDGSGSYRSKIQSQVIRQQIESGEWDRFSLIYSISPTGSDLSQLPAEFLIRQGEHYYLKLTRASFALASEYGKQQMVERLVSYYRYKHYPVYRVITMDMPVGGFPVADFLDWQTVEFPFATHRFLSGFGRRWAYQVNSKAGANCWHSSIASISKAWVASRYMGENEFACHLGKSFVRIEQPEEFGDLIRIQDTKGNEVHGFTYVGHTERGERITFTKNGYSPGHYLFMRLEDVVRGYGGLGQEVSYYRMTSEAIDPHENLSAPCRPHYQTLSRSNGNSPDALLTKAMENNPLEKLKPIEWTSIPK